MSHSTQNPQLLASLLPDEVIRNVRIALAEDIGAKDITAELIPENTEFKASVICREPAIICGIAWANETFRQVDPRLVVDWQCSDGDSLEENATLFFISGPARSLLTAERTALNFLQCLSATATTCGEYAKHVKGSKVKLLDTRKTLPGLRLAQKYAVSCGGCFNHRIGLYDAYLIKENHIAACGSIATAVAQAKHNEPTKPVEVEVENKDELLQALEAGADIVMLDNFSIEQLHDAVAATNGRAKLEASGNVSLDRIAELASTGVDYISIGALTKNVSAIDLSMRFQ